MRTPLLCLVLLFLLTACAGDPPVPRPRSYPRINFPDRATQPLAADYCNFTFQRPATATEAQTTSFFDEEPADPCWFDLQLASELNGKIYFSYSPITSFERWEELRDDAFQLVGVHNERASDIEEIVIHRDSARVHGIAFDISGPAASPFQFFLTDSTQHFLRGALYFDAKVNPDSLAPVVAYVKEDIFNIIESLEWKE